MQQKKNSDWLSKSSYTPPSSSNNYSRVNFQANSSNPSRQNIQYENGNGTYQNNYQTNLGTGPYDTRYNPGINENMNGTSYNQFSNYPYKDVKRLPEEYSSMRQTFTNGSNNRIRDMISNLDSDPLQSTYTSPKKENLYSSKAQNLISSKKFRNTQLQQKLKKYSSGYDQLTNELQNTSKVSEQIKKLKEERRKRLEEKQREKNNQESNTLSSSYSLGSLTNSLKLNNVGRYKYETKDYGIDSKYNEIVSDPKNSGAFNKKKRFDYQPYTPKYEKKPFADYTSPSKQYINIDKYKQKQTSSTLYNKYEYKPPVISEVSPLYTSSATTTNYSNYSSKNIVSPTNVSKKKSQSGKYNEINGFRIGKLLGEGKFGAVYQGFHKATGWLYAIKKVPKQMIKSHLMQDQFILELKIQTYLSHENILSIYTCFDDQTHIYLVLEYMDQLKKSKILPETEVATKIKQIASALKYMHQSKIAHRDIKPQNIVMSHGVCKLCDFGWATICDDRRKTYCGTFDYASPQILQGAQYDEKVDLWCLGILTYELLVGKAPFYHISRKQTMKKILNVQNTAIEYPDNISEKAKSFIEHLVRKDPKDRINSQMLLEHPFLKYAEKIFIDKY